MASRLNSLGHQQLTVSNTAVGLTVPAGTTRAVIQCGATNTVRWSAGVTPTASLGIELAAGTILDLSDPMGEYPEFIRAIRFIRTASDATLDIEYFG